MHAPAVITPLREHWAGRAGERRHLLMQVAVGMLVVGLGAIALVHFGNVGHLVDRIGGGDPVWLSIAVALEAVSFAGYVAMTRMVFEPAAPRLTGAASVELTLAGVVATRLLSAGGAGGIAFTGWVLGRAGMGAREAASRLAAFLVLLYSVYMGALLVGGLVVVTGLVPGVPHGLGLAGAGVGATVILAALALQRIPPDLGRRTRLAVVPEVAGDAMRTALAVARATPVVLVGAVVWWAFDVGVIWAAFNAFGEAPRLATIVLCYFLGMLGNLLPLPGGVGGTEGGMLGAFAACGTDAGLALAAIVAYQAISTYLPVVPGLLAYGSLRRRMQAWDDERAVTA